MTKHKILINWILIYIIFLCLCLSLLFYFEAIRVQIALILLILLVSFIFSPIHLLDKRSSKKNNKEHIGPKPKGLITRSNELGKATEKGVMMEPELKSEIFILNNKEEEPKNKVKIYCKFCGKKINEDVKICPYCGTSL